MKVRSAFVTAFSPAGLEAFSSSIPEDKTALFLSGGCGVVVGGPKLKRSVFWKQIHVRGIPLLDGLNSAVEGLVIWMPPGMPGPVAAALYSESRVLDAIMADQEHVVQSEKIQRDLAASSLGNLIAKFAERPDGPFLVS